MERNDRLLMVISYDQKNTSYVIFDDEREAFLNWVLTTWAAKYASIAKVEWSDETDGMDSCEILEEAGVNVREEAIRLRA